jgi:hypothetical protein
MKSSFIKRVAVVLCFLMIATQFSIPVYAVEDTPDANNIEATLIDDTGSDEPEPTLYDENDDEENEEPTELSEDVDAENVVDVVTEDLGNVTTDSTAETLMEEAANEVLESLEGKTQDEIVEALENVEANIDTQVSTLNTQLNQIPTVAGGGYGARWAEHYKLQLKIRHLLALRAKLKAKIIKKYPNIIQKIRRIKNMRAIYSVRWGDLSGINHCAGTRVIEILQSLASGEAPCGIESYEYSGTISVDTGILKVRKKVLFEPNYDEVTQMEGSSISFNSTIAGHWDGLIVEYIPATNDDGTKPEVNVTISLGNLNETYTGSQVIGRKDIGNGHMVEIRRIASMIQGISTANQDVLIQQKINVEEKISNIHDKIYRLRMLGKNKEVLDEIENAVDETEEYNFDEASSAEVQNEIDAIVAELKDAVSKVDLQNIIQKLRRKIEEIKAKAKSRKFVKGMIPFKDTDDSEWYTNYVSKAKNRGIISGYKDATGNPLGEFRPANNITIAEILKIALETSGNGQSEGEPALVAARNHWAKGYVKKAEELGLNIVSDNVDINRPATRGEVIRIMLEALGVKPDPITKSDFFDVLVSHVHAAYIQYAKDLGIISGDAGTNNFRPDDSINRAEASKIANQILDNLIGGDEPWE